MTDFLIGALKIGFLALLWLFILFVVITIKTDLFGQKVKTEKKTKSRFSRQRPNKLIITSGAQKGEAFQLQSELHIGRNFDCQVTLQDDYASGKHARIYLANNDVILADLGSTNGTFLNEERITIPTPITDRDIIRIGHTTMRVEA